MATLQEVVNTAYLQALGRPADPDGLSFYAGQLESGAKSVGDIIADLNYAALPVEAGGGGLEDKAANQAITARGGWDFAPPPPPPAPSGGGGGGGSSVTPPDVVAPPSSNYGYINDLYKTYLGRDAGAEELAFYAGVLGPTIEPNEIRDFILGGVTSGEISSTLAADLLKTLPPPAAATEPLTAQGLYNQFLGGRPALEKDLQFWNDYIAQYGPEQAMAAFDAAADQERDMDLAARAASLRDQELARDGTVMKDGEKTVREGALTAQGLYNEFLGGRSALPADIDYWNNYIAVYGPDKARAAFDAAADQERKMPVEERVKSLRDQNLTVPGSLLGDFETQRKATPAEVRSMYLSVLGREPDPKGFSYYTSQPVENLRQSFYQASLPEMEKRVGAIDVTTTIPTPVIGQRSEPTAQELYLGLGRAPDPAGLAFYENYSGPNREAAFAAGAAEKGEQYDPTKPMTIGLPGQTTTTSLSGMTPQQRDLSRLVVSKMPQPVSETTTAPSVFSPENVAAQLELERLKAMNAPRTTDQGTPVAGFAQGGLVNDDINRMLRNQQSAIQRESQSRRMLTNLGAPPVKKFSDGGPAGSSSSGVRRLKMSGYQKGGEVTDEMFVGTAPSEESQQTTGEYIKGLYKENIPVHARVYLETLLGKKDPITAEDFTKEELADIEKLLSPKPAKGAVTEYSDYEKVRDLDREGRHSSDWLENLPSVGKTLGRFTYETLPDGRRVIKDTYDFYNTSRSINVQEFEEMGPAEKALAVFKKITANRSMMDPPFVKRAADILGEAYIGRDGRPVKVEYDPKDLPVKRQDGSPPEGEVNENPYVRMAREERAAQDKAFDSVNRQLSDLLERYKEGNEGITEKDLLPFFPGYNEYDIAQMYGTTTESSVPSMSSKARSFTPEIMSNLRKYDELMQKDFDRLVKEKRLPRDVITARTLGLANGGEVTNDEFIQEMFTGTRPEDFPETSPVDKKAGELLRALSEGTRGFVGAEPIEAGSEAYRTGQALANMPAVGVVAATAKGAGKAKDALKALTKKDIKLIASELETSRGQLAELAKKYPQLRDASVADIEALTKGEPFTAFRGISLLPGRELRKESTPSMTVDPSVALGMLKDAPVMITKEGFITATPVLRQYPGMKASETQVYVPSLIEQITERQPGALEMKIPTRSGEKMTVADVFKEVKGEKELLADVSKKEPRDILFDRYQGGVGDRYLMEVARRVLAGKWDGGEALLKEIGGYQTDPKGLVQEFDSFAELVKESALKKAKGGEVTNDEFIQEMMTGTRPTDETTSPGILPPEIRQAVDVPLDFANLLIRGTAAVPIGGVAGLYKGITGGKYGTQEGVKEADTEAARMMAKITGEPKTQAAKDVLEFIGGKAQEYKLDAALPQLLTLPSPGPGAASALMRSYELAETPPLGTVKLAGDKGVKPATPPTDQMGFYSPAEKAVMGLPQDKGTASQMLAQITKTQGVKPVELRATGLEDYLKGKGNEPVTKQEIQDFLTNNRVQVDEVVLGKGQTLSPEAKKLSGEALSRMEEVDDKLASYFEGVEEVAGQDPYSAFIMLRSSIGRRAAKGDQEALDELNAFNLPPEIKDLVLEFGRNKNEYIKYTSQARKMEKPKFDGYNTSGGTNAREIYLTLPGEQMPSSSPPSVNAQGVLVKPMYATQPKFTAPSPHSVSPEADANRLAHIFLDERKDAKGNNVLFVQEMQSDWAQTGRDKGFQTKTTSWDGPEYKAARARATDLLNEFNRNNANPVRQQEIRPLLEEARRVEQSFVDNRQKLPAAPFVTNTEDWVNLALKRVIKEAVDNDIDTVAFIKGGQAADKYSLRTFVDHISADRGLATGDDLYVSITPKDSLSPHAFYVGPDGIIKEPISADVRSKFLGEPLSKVIGKETAEKLLSTKIGESQVLRDEGLTLGGKGMEGFYDNILPKTAEKLLKKLGGGKVEPVEMVKAAPSQMPYEANAFLHWMSFRHPGTSRSDAARAWGMGMDNNQFVKEFYEETTPKADQYLGFKITPEMKEMVKTEGLPKFAAGGEVTDFIKRAA
jgi:hypothetical protein